MIPGPATTFNQRSQKNYLASNATGTSLLINVSANNNVNTKSMYNYIAVDTKRTKNPAT